MLPLFPDSHALGAAIDLFDRLSLAMLGGCFPLPLSLRWSTARAFSGCRAVLGTTSLHIPVILVCYNSARHLFSPVEWNEGCWRTNSAECCGFDKKNRPITSEDIIQGGRTCSDCLLLQQGLISGGALKYDYYFQQLYNSSEAFCFEHVRAKLCFRRSN